MMLETFFQLACEKHALTGLGVSIIHGDKPWATGFDWADKAARQFVSAGGSDYGFTSYLMIVPDRQIGLACLCNDGMQHAVMQALPHAALRKLL